MQNWIAWKNILLGQVGHAAGQGLLETTSELSVDQALSNDEAPLGENFSIVTSVDREVRKLGPNVNLKPSEQECRKIADLDVSRWENEQDISTRIGELRSEIFGEFDKIDEAALRRLAKTYLYYGFGAEAKTDPHDGFATKVQPKVPFGVSGCSG